MAAAPTCLGGCRTHLHRGLPHPPVTHDCHTQSHGCRTHLQSGGCRTHLQHMTDTYNHMAAAPTCKGGCLTHLNRRMLCVICFYVWSYSYTPFVLGRHHCIKVAKGWRPSRSQFHSSSCTHLQSAAAQMGQITLSVDRVWWW